jgi:hypothetical protein
MAANVTLPLAIRQAVEDALSQRFGTTVRLAEAENIWATQVFLCTLQSSSDAAPGTVIVRIPREGFGIRLGRGPLDKERAALEYLTGAGSTLVPRFFAGGAEAGFIATEDIGDYPSLLDILLGNEPDAATDGAIAFARGLGALHAQTIECGNAAANLPHQPPPIGDYWRQVREASAHLGLPAPDGVDRDIEEIVHILAEPGDYLALSSGDPSVVNCKVINGGIRFFDFEEACFRHALLDAAVLRVFYPTGGPAWRLPPGIVPQMESAYRAELARACPTVSDNVSYEQGMAAASAAWMILRMVRLPRVDAGPDQDPWLLLPPGWSSAVPLRSRRRQLVSILETWTASAQQVHTFDALAAWCVRMIDSLRLRWPEATEELPLYPAFRFTP